MNNIFGIGPGSKRHAQPRRCRLTHGQVKRGIRRQTRILVPKGSRRARSSLVPIARSYPPFYVREHRTEARRRPIKAGTAVSDYWH